MKESKYLFIILFLPSISNGQDYSISFTASDQGARVTSVRVENLSQGTSLTLSGNDVLRLLGVFTEAEDGKEADETGIKFWPNPASVRAQMDFFLPEPGDVQIVFFNPAGKVVHRRDDFLGPGKHSYSIDAPGRGLYLVRIIHSGGSVTGRFISNSVSKGSIKIDYIGASAGEKRIVSTKKAARAEVVMQYNEGDRLKFTGISENNKTIITDVPSSDKAIEFGFHPCRDAGGYNYPVVAIGSQVWMAENLKTTLYNDSMPIPLVEDSMAWAALDFTNSPGYCWYENDSVQYGNIYGALYNAWAVNTGKLCPAGWHIPSSREWLELCLLLDPDAITGVVSLTAGGKLKETGTEHWEPPNEGATNVTGFTALPGGNRFIDGSFTGIGRYGYWSGDNGYSFHYMEFQSGVVDFTEGRTENGHSVRCIKND
jgi:uncharacterized protein (TIGR02145 family)